MNDSWASVGCLYYTSEQWDEFSPLVDHLVRQFQSQGYSPKDHIVIEMGSVGYHDGSYMWTPVLPKQLWVEYLETIDGQLHAKTNDWETHMEYTITTTDNELAYITTAPPYEKYHIFQRTSTYPDAHFLFAPVANAFGCLKAQRKQHFSEFDQVRDDYTSVKVYRERKYVAHVEPNGMAVTFAFRQVYEAERIGMIHPDTQPMYQCQISTQCQTHEIPLLVITMLEKMIRMQHHVPMPPPYYLISSTDATEIDPLGKRVQLWIEKFCNIQEQSQSQSQSQAEGCSNPQQPCTDQISSHPSPSNDEQHS